jgi:hypothetical protein
VPKLKEVYKKVTKHSLKCAQTRKRSAKKKKFKIPFHTLLSGLVPGFKISPPVIGTLQNPKTGDETNRGDGTGHGTGGDFLHNCIKRGVCLFI